MIFSLKLAMEIADYKKHPFHVLFVDLVEAYDSVSRAGLWEVLRRKRYSEETCANYSGVLFWKESPNQC